MERHIIELVLGWREKDYDGYNDYYVNPSWSPHYKSPQMIDRHRDKELESIEIKIEERIC